MTRNSLPSCLLIFFMVANTGYTQDTSGVSIDQCLSTAPPSGIDDFTIGTAVNFTTADCPVSNETGAPCFEACLKPNVNLRIGMSAYAQCRVPASGSGQVFNRASLTYHPPNSDTCIRFQTETDNQWHHYDEHIHFRRKMETIEILIINALEEHRNVTIVCLPSNTLSPVPQDCRVKGVVLFVNSPNEDIATATTPLMITNGILPNRECDCFRTLGFIVVTALMGVSIVINILLLILVIKCYKNSKYE